MAGGYRYFQCPACGIGEHDSPNRLATKMTLDTVDEIVAEYGFVSPMQEPARGTGV